MNTKHSFYASRRRRRQIRMPRIYVYDQEKMKFFVCIICRWNHIIVNIIEHMRRRLFLSVLFIFFLLHFYSLRADGSEVQTCDLWGKEMCIVMH